MLKKLKINKGVALALALVLSVTGAAVAIGSILASQEVTWQAVLPSNINPDNTIDVSGDDGKYGKVVLTGENAVSWGSSDTLIARQTGGGFESAEYTAVAPGFFVAYRSTNIGAVGSTNSAVYNSTMPASYRITKNHSVLRREGQTDTVPITMRDMKNRVITDAITWVSDAPSVATVDANSGEITAVSNSGTANITGRFTDCYGQAQSISYSAVVGVLNSDAVVGPDGDNNYWKPVGEPSHIWEKVAEDGTSENPREYVYDKDDEGPADSTNPSTPVTKGEDGKFWREGPANIWTLVLPNGELGGDDDKIWGGPDGQPRTPDDESVKNFGTVANPDYWVSYGENVFAGLNPSTGLIDGALTGGGSYLNPKTNPVRPIFDNRGIDGHFYYGPFQDNDGMDYYIGDNYDNLSGASNGDGLLNSNDRNTLHSTDRIYYRKADGTMVDEKPVEVVPAANIVFENLIGNTVKVDDKQDAPTVKVLPDNATSTAVEWTSSNPEFATVDPITGEIKGIATGKTTIMATVTNPSGSVPAVTIASYIVTIEPKFVAATDFSVPAVVAVHVGRTKAGPVPSITPANAEGYTIKYSSGNTARGTVNADTGEVTGLSANTSATITATLTNDDGSQIVKTYRLRILVPEVLSDDLTGDGDWVEITRTGAYSLIVRGVSVGTSSFSRGGQYRPYVEQSTTTASEAATSRGELRFAINNWYKNELSAGVRLRDYVVGHDALEKPGIYGSLNDPSGFSAPTGLAAPADGVDVAFPLSFQEAASYCSTIWYELRGYDGSSPVGDFVQSEQWAINNFCELNDAFMTGAFSGGWLRSPGLIGKAPDGSDFQLHMASFLNMNGNVDCSPVLINGAVRPALWVRSTIFNY